MGLWPITVYTKIKAGHADALREALVGIRNAQTKDRSALKEIGTLHDARRVIFDQDTRYMFASVFDGSWDTYIDDFATTVVGAKLRQGVCALGRVPRRRQFQREGLLAWRQWHGRPRAGEPVELPKWMSAIDSFNFITATGLGFALAGLNVKNLLMCAAAGAGIGSARLVERTPRSRSWCSL